MNFDKQNRKMNNIEKIKEWVRDNRKGIDIAMVLLLALSGEYMLSIIFILIFVLDMD
jgi:hypothetical protein